MPDTSELERVEQEADREHVQMTIADYHAAANEAREHAVGWLRQKPTTFDGLGRAGRLVKAAELLDAAETFTMRANLMTNFGPEVDETTIEKIDG